MGDYFFTHKIFRKVNMKRNRSMLILSMLSFIPVCIAADFVYKQPLKGTTVSTSTGFRYTPSSGVTGQDKVVIKLDKITEIGISIVNSNPNISGTLKESNGSVFSPEKLNNQVIQFRGSLNGRPYNYDAVLGNDGRPKRITPIAPTTAIEIIGYPTNIIEGYPNAN